jgi:hypothetical protein
MPFKKRTPGGKTHTSVNVQLVSVATDSCTLFIPASDRKTSATSKRTRRALEKTADSTQAAMWSVLAFAPLGDGDRAGGALFAHQPHQPCQHQNRHSPLQGRALCRLRRRLRRVVPHRPGRLDLVYEVRRLGDVPHGTRGHSGLQCARRPAGDRPLHPEILERLRHRLAHRIIGSPSTTLTARAAAS